MDTKIGCSFFEGQRMECVRSVPQILRNVPFWYFLVSYINRKKHTIGSVVMMK